MERDLTSRIPIGCLCAGLLCTAAGCRVADDLGGAGSAGSATAPGSETEPSGGAGDPTGDTDDTGMGSASGGGGGPDFPPPGPPGGEDCPELACLPCGNGQQCADEGPYFGTSCCAAGDALVHRGTGQAAEAVDIEVAEGIAFLCGGFGVRTNRVDTPDDIAALGGVAPRCQHVPLSAGAGDLIDVGDTLPAEFGFLSPTGQVEGLQGNVVVVAYFALF